MAWLLLPPSVGPEEVDSDQALVLYPGGIESQRQYVYRHRRRRQCATSIFAIFDKAEFLKAVGDKWKVESQVVGQLKTGQYFYGGDTVWIKRWHWKSWHQRRH